MNKKMTIVGALLMAVAVTGYSVSGTYAKYVSEVDKVDTARVAKFKLNVGKNTSDIDLFSKSYTSNGETYVKSLDTDQVVAPGTKGEYKFTLDGNFEVKTQLDVVATLVGNDNKTVLKDSAGNYVLDTINIKYICTDDTHCSESTDAAAVNYSPIKYHLYEGTTELTTGNTLVDLKTALDGLSQTIAAGKNLAQKEYTISWEWPIESTVEGSTVKGNILDTLIGNRMVNDPSNEANHLRIRLNVKATQITDGTNLASADKDPTKE